MPSPSPALLELLSKVVAGEAPRDELMQQLQREQLATAAPAASPAESASDSPSASDPRSAMVQVPGATIDLGRESRCGFGEVIYGEGKSAELISSIIQSQLQASQSALVTRIDSGVAFQVRQCFRSAHHNPLARTLTVASENRARREPLTESEAAETLHAAVVTAGSTDAPVAEEAVETLAWMGVPHQRFEDIGVAGPQRLIAAAPRLRLASAIVVVAGMEGALPAALAGHVSVPVFAVPTSVGYGANLGGLTPLMGMLSTCTANVAVVNIDGGFKGGFMAGLVVRQLEQATQRGSDPANDSPHTDHLSSTQG